MIYLDFEGRIDFLASAKEPVQGWGEKYTALHQSSFGHFNAYLVVFGLFLPKTEEKN